MIDFIDNEEKELIESLHSEDWLPNPDKNLNKIYEEYARNSMDFNQNIEIVLTEKDTQKIQANAIREGIPYQALISMLLHKYNEGKIVII